MWDYFLGIGVSLLTAWLTYYWYTHRYNDEITELLTIKYNDFKCIKYYYRGNKYIFLTENLEDDIKRLEKEIDVTNPDKDKKPESCYKYIKAKIFINTDTDTDTDTYTDTDTDNENDQIEEVLFEEDKLLYSFIGPANSFYFAFDVDYYKKLTKFMNYLFETDEGMLIYGRFSALLSPQRYFEIKNKLIHYKTEYNVKKIEWELV